MILIVISDLVNLGQFEHTNLVFTKARVRGTFLVRQIFYFGPQEKQNLKVLQKSVKM